MNQPILISTLTTNSESTLILHLRARQIDLLHKLKGTTETNTKLNCDKYIYR